MCGTKNAMASTTAHPYVTNEATRPAGWVYFSFLLWVRKHFQRLCWRPESVIVWMRPKARRNLACMGRRYAFQGLVSGLGMEDDAQCLLVISARQP